MMMLILISFQGSEMLILTVLPFFFFFLTFVYGLGFGISYISDITLYTLVKEKLMMNTTRELFYYFYQSYFFFTQKQSD